MKTSALLALVLATAASLAVAQPVQLRIKSDYEAGTQAHANGDLTMAIDFFTQGAAKRDRRSEFALGTHYYFGEGVKRSYAKAMEYFERSVAQGYAPAMTMLGTMHRHGIGAPLNKVKSAELFTRAAYACEDKAQDALAQMLHGGEGIPANKVEALAWLHVASAANDDAKDGVKMVTEELNAAQRKAALVRKDELAAKLQCPKS